MDHPWPRSKATSKMTKARKTGTTNSIDWEAKKVAEELRNSPTLKVFRYVPKRGRKPHLYTETSNGTKFPLCGKAVDETVTASQIVAVRGDECSMCNRAAQEIFKRKVD
jgi:hypothetical protein